MKINKEEKIKYGRQKKKKGRKEGKLKKEANK